MSISWTSWGLFSSNQQKQSVDKNRPLALFSLQPSRLTGLLYGARNLWDDHLWWSGCPLFAVMFSMVMMLSLRLKPQNRHPPCDSISAQKWLLTAPLRVEKYFPVPLSPPPATTPKLYIHSSAKFIYAVFFSEGDASSLNLSLWWRWGWFETTLIQLLHTGDVMPRWDCTGKSKAVAWNSAHWLLVIMAAL